MRLRNLPPRRDTRDAQDVYPLPQPYLRSLLQKPLPGAAVITLHGSGWKIPRTSRVTSGKASSGDGVGGIPRLTRPSPLQRVRGTRERNEASSVTGHASRGSLMCKDLHSPDALAGEVKRSPARVGHLVIGRSL